MYAPREVCLNVFIHHSSKFWVAEMLSGDEGSLLCLLFLMVDCKNNFPGKCPRAPRTIMGLKFSAQGVNKGHNNFHSIY